MNAISYPPHRLFSSRQLTEEETLDKLNNYISLSSNKPYLLPNAVLTKHGPTANSGASSGGLVMHNLERVAKGLAGENLGGTGEVLEKIGGAKKNKKRSWGKDGQDTNGGLEVSMDEHPARVDNGEDEEVDIRAEDDMHVVNEGQEAVGEMEVETKPISKEERKRLKLERRKVEKRDREEKRKKKNKD